MKWLKSQFYIKGALIKSETIFDNSKPFKNDEKCFLFHLKSSFRSKDLSIFVSTFWSCWKTAWLESYRWELQVKVTLNEKNKFDYIQIIPAIIRDHLLISLLLLSKFKTINFYSHLNSLNIWSKIGRRSLRSWKVNINYLAVNINPFVPKAPFL